MHDIEWLRSADSVQLLAQLNRSRGDRKLLLLGVACCRRQFALLTSPDSRAAVEWAERFADGEAQRDERYERLEWASEGAAFRCETANARDRFEDCSEETRGPIAESNTDLAVGAVYFANALMTLDTHEPFDPSLRAHAQFLVAPIVRDIFGNPFRSVAFSPEWRTGTALSLARTMYEARDFSAMPILADALQDAGCNNDAILDHCRDTQQVHVRGCWVVDLVLGKE